MQSDMMTLQEVFDNMDFFEAADRKEVASLCVS